MKFDINGVVTDNIFVAGDIARTPHVLLRAARAGIADTYFAWSGPTRNGSAAYFRIQGPSVEIEYAPQDSNEGHIHTFYRDPMNDYGKKVRKP